MKCGYNSVWGLVDIVCFGCGLDVLVGLGWTAVDVIDYFCDGF